MRLLTVIGGFLSIASLASQAELFGLGGSTTGRANAVIAEPDNAYAAQYNPSVMSLNEESLFSYSTSFTSSHYGGILPSVYSSAWAIGLTHPFYLPTLFSRRAAIGISVNGPYSKLRSLTAHAPEDYYSLRYGNTDSQFRTTIGTSMEIWPDSLFFGIGLSLYLTGAGTAETTINTQNPTGRMAMDVGLNTAIVSGVLLKIDDTNIGFAYHQAIEPTFVQTLDANAQVGAGDIRQPMTLRATLYYEPHEIEVEAQHPFTEGLKASMGFSYEFWSQYKPAILIAETLDSSGNTIQTQLPAGTYRNTINPKASVEYELVPRTFVVSLGYQYRPTPIEDTAGLNILDSDTHIAGVSITHRLPMSPLVEVPVEWGAYAQMHWLQSREVKEKSVVFSGNANTYGLFLKAKL